MCDHWGSDSSVAPPASPQRLCSRTGPGSSYGHWMMIIMYWTYECLSACCVAMTTRCFWSPVFISFLFVCLSLSLYDYAITTTSVVVVQRSENIGNWNQITGTNLRWIDIELPLLANVNKKLTSRSALHRVRQRNAVVRKNRRVVATLCDCGLRHKEDSLQIDKNCTAIPSRCAWDTLAWMTPRVRQPPSTMS